jgi:hypothetical protein
VTRGGHALDAAARALGTGLILLLVLAAIPVLAAGAARAQSFVEEVSGDACDRARAFDLNDVGPAAQQARRACRLEHFEYRLAAERRQEVAAGEEASQARVQLWMDRTQPARVLRPLAVEGFLSTGVTSYGLTFTWQVLRRLELAARIGWRKLTCPNEISFDGGDCSRTSLGMGTRWFFGDQNLSPFLGGGFSVTNAHLQVASTMPAATDGGGSGFLAGDGRANAVSGSAGMALSAQALRMSVEYVFEYAFYTGANLNDPQKTPSEELRIVWRDSLKSDRHGIRFQVGYAF